MQWVFGVGLLTGVSQILPRPTLVAITTKFGEFGRKFPITWVASKICSSTSSSSSSSSRNSSSGQLDNVIQICILLK